MKRACYILGFSLIIVVIFLMIRAYSLLESNTTRVVEKELGKWVILVNDLDVTGDEVEFEIENISYETASTVEAGRLAPGLGGHFDITIDPTDTDVSVRYDIIFDYTDINETDINISNIVETNGNELIQTGESTYTGVIPLSDIKNGGRTDNIRTSITWNNNENNNEKDSEIGLVENNTVSIPVTVKLTQYTGEEIVEY